MAAWIVICSMLILSITQSIESGNVFITNFIHTSTFSENADNEMALTTFSVTSDSSCGIISCSITASSELFNISGGPDSYNLYKRGCSDPKCGRYPEATPCSAADGCASESDQKITVNCTGNNSYCHESAEHKITFTAESPTLDITNLHDSVNADNTGNVGDVIFTTKTSDLSISYYEEATSVGNSWGLNTIQLFRLNVTDGTVYIAEDPSYEYSQTFTMEICVYSRRQKACGNLTINFSGCFQTPTCENQGPLNIADTFDIGDTLFKMNVPRPTEHFTSISESWQGLNFTIESTDLNVTYVDPVTGNITTTGNITVYPSYPNKAYIITVRVGNSESCNYTSTCNMSLIVNFTNWDIEFVNLNSSVPIHEDKDDRNLLFTVTTTDLNSPDEDNVTCNITTNPDPYMFEMVNNGTGISRYEYNSSQIYKKKCENRGCGPICANGTACLNYDIVNKYEIVVECSDAYGSTATGTLTVNVQANEPPEWTNLPMNITVNTDYVADMDVIFTFYYRDTESESLEYNYTDISTINDSFSFDAEGNFNDNPANVTALVHQWDRGNETYTIYVCGTERRNTVCGVLTIQLRDFCGPSPNCTNQAATVTDLTDPGTTLFSINVTAPSTGSFSGLSYSIASNDILLFDVDMTGNVRSVSKLPIKSPPNPTSYSITAYVYDSAACQIGVCHLGLNVTFTNFNISIVNMDGVSRNLSEDTLTQNTLLTIATSDANTVDGVTCVIDEANSVPANNGKFLTKETSTGSNVYVIVNKENPQFDVDQVYTVAVTCSDLYGSSDSANMTVTINENAVPVLSNLSPGTTISVDLATVFSGDSVFTLTATDEENDALTYFCNVTSTLVPLQCNTAGMVSLRRNVTMAENGTTYQVLMCVEEQVHTHVVCETLSVLFTSSMTAPQISNLPSTETFNETTSVGTVLFTVSVSDPDSGDVHTFRLNHVQPVKSWSMFSFSASTGELTLASSFDYEIQTTYNLTFSVADEHLSSVEYKMLYIQVSDVNEGPALTLHTTWLSTSEGSAGKEVGIVIYSCTDIDAGQTTTVTLSSGTHMSHFSMDSATGSLTLARDWDFESESLPEITTLGITCSDGEGLTDSRNFAVAISPLNEFAPVLNITEVELTIYTNQTLQDSLFSVGVNDSDYNDDGQFEYSVAGIGMGKQHFTMSNQGELFLSNYLTWNYNFTFRFTLKVSDGEASPLTASVNVIIHYIAPEVVVPTGRAKKCLLCTTEGILVISVISIGGFLILAFILHACIRTRAWTLCQSEPIRQHEKQTKKSQRRRQREDLLEMLREEDTDQDHVKDKDYKPDKDRLNRAIPTRQPPERFMYLGSRDMPPIPGRAEYNPPAIELSTIPLTNQISQSRFRHTTKKEWNNPVEASHPSQDHLYKGSAVPSRLFPPSAGYQNTQHTVDKLTGVPGNLTGKIPRKRKLYN